MKDDKLEAAVNEDIDGFATPEASAQLRQTLAADAEARAYRDDLLQLNRVLAAGAEPAPPELKPAILRGIDRLPVPGAPARRPVREARPGWGETLAAFFRGPGFGRAGLVFGSGVAVGLITFALASNPALRGGNDLTGAMAPAAVETAPLTDRRSFDLDGVRGTLETRFAGDSAWLVLALDAGAAARFDIDFGGQARPLAVERSHPASGTLTLEPSRAVIEAVSPDRIVVRLGFLESGSSAEAVVRIAAAGRTAEETLALRP